jgi:hypothetical protein
MTPALELFKSGEDVTVSRGQVAAIVISLIKQGSRQAAIEFIRAVYRAETEDPVSLSEAEMILSIIVVGLVPRKEGKSVH